MKRKLSLLLAFTLVLTTIGCGTDIKESTESNNKVETEVNKNSETIETEPNLSFNNYFQVGGFKFYYPDKDLATVENGSKGYLIDTESSYKTRISYQDANIKKVYWECTVCEPYWDITEIKNLNVTFDNIVEVCTDRLIKEEFGAFRQNLFGNSGNNNLKQVVKSSEKIVVNGIEMLKVLGTFENVKSEPAVSFDYIAYYMICETTAGTKIPVYYLGHGFIQEVSDTNRNYATINDYYEDVEKYVEESIKYTQYLWGK